jgi:acyl-[acyl-carrier-protein]-phospholipid O-acyltransferase / long-chain-fatty-acid--[acyl-carrier-protein] ligase
VLLHQHFIDIAKNHGEKLAINDFSTEKKVTYSKALIATLLLGNAFKKLEEEYVGIMLPTSAGCVFTKIGILFSGKIPIMINYST